MVSLTLSSPVDGSSEISYPAAAFFTSSQGHFSTLHNHVHVYSLLPGIRTIRAIDVPNPSVLKKRTVVDHSLNTHTVCAYTDWFMGK